VVFEGVAESNHDQPQPSPHNLLSGWLFSRVSRKSKSEIYIDLLPMLNSGRVALLDHPKMVAQLCGLERRTTRGTGRDIIDHPPNGHDDLVNVKEYHND
jgi:hypothetical protein